MVVVERGVLGTRGFQRFLREHRGLPLPDEEDAIGSSMEAETLHGNIQNRARRVFDEWIERRASGSLERPIAIAVTVSESFFRHVEDHLRYAGPFLLWQAIPTDGTPDTIRTATEIVAIRVMSRCWRCWEA